MTAGFKGVRLQRIAAFALLATTLAIAAAVVAVPIYFAHGHYDGEIARMQRQFNAFTTLNRQKPQFVQAVDVLKSRDAKKYFLKGASPALASAELQDAVKSTVESSGGRVLSVQALPTSDEAGYRRMGATFQINTNIQNLRLVLYTLEAKEPYLFMDALTVRAQVPSSFKPSPGVEPDMFIQFDVFGYALPTPKQDGVALPAQTKPTGAKT